MPVLTNALYKNWCQNAPFEIATWPYFIRGVEKKKCNHFIKFFEADEIQNVKKIIGESNISESTTVVVVKDLFSRSRRSAARDKTQETCDPHARRARRTQAGGNNNNYI